MNSTEKRSVGRPRDKELTSRRREQILVAATEHFAKSGYDGTDLQVLADQISVGKGTIYRYFPNKRNLFLSSVDRGMKSLSQHINQSVADVIDPLDRIAGAVRAYLSFFDTNPELVELVIQERAVFKDRKKPTYFEHRETALTPWRQLICQLIETGRIRRVSVERILDVMSDLLYGTIFTNYFASRRTSFETQASDILDILFHGFLSDAERAARASDSSS